MPATVTKSDKSILQDGLDLIACWSEGPEVTSSFDNPSDVKLAREVLKSAETCTVKTMTPNQMASNIIRNVWDWGLLELSAKTKLDGELAKKAFMGFQKIAELLRSIDNETLNVICIIE